VSTFYHKHFAINHKNENLKSLGWKNKVTVYFENLLHVSDMYYVC